MNWRNDVPKFPNCHYRINVPWSYLTTMLHKYVDEYGLDMNPDFQRGHIWTEEQQIRYVEFVLRVPQSGLEIYFNHPGWQGSFNGHFVLVDGKQRLEAARRFLANEIPAFGCPCKDIEWPGKRGVSRDVEFFFNVACLKKRADVLRWYLDFNSGGTPHAEAEIQRVRQLLAKEFDEEMVC